ncbi:hypothetical protein NT95_05625 [Oenococcus kitaharae]|nr:hypothetical protein NT95_05625 [Oenococcus kitaharae]OEY85492.1 hypothetical protein NT96_02070 [Oenococcus kitaharae]OEY86345.1 hypothetical protein NV75_02020 [Oenococcus kitaharae]
MKQLYILLGLLVWDVISKNNISPWVYLGIVLLIIGWGIVRYICFTFAFDENGLTINSGLFIRRHDHIPFGRIQTTQHKQWFFLRPFGIESLLIQTAGHEDKESQTELPAVSIKISNLIDQLYQNKEKTGSDLPIANQSDQANQIPDNYATSTRDLSKYALTSFTIFPILGALMTLYSQLNQFLPNRFLKPFETALDHLRLNDWLIVVTSLLLLGAILSYLLILQRYYHFVLIKKNNKLTTVRGLFQRQTLGSSLKKLQAVMIEQNILRQWLHLATIKAVVASEAGSKNRDDNNFIITPVISEKVVPSHLHHFVNWIPDSFPKLDYLPKICSWYFVRNAVCLSLIPIALSIFFWHQWGLISLLLLPIAVSLGIYKGQSTALVLLADNQSLVLQTGRLWTKQITILQRKNIQSLVCRQTIWMAGRNLTHLCVNIRQGDGNQEVQIRYLSDEKSLAIYRWYLQKTDFKNQ